MAVYYDAKLDELFNLEVEKVKDLHYKEKFPSLNEEQLKQKKLNDTVKEREKERRNFAKLTPMQQQMKMRPQTAKVRGNSAAPKPNAATPEKEKIQLKPSYPLEKDIKNATGVSAVKDEMKAKRDDLVLQKKIIEEVMMMVYDTDMTNSATVIYSQYRR